LAIQTRWDSGADFAPWRLVLSPTVLIATPRWPLDQPVRDERSRLIALHCSLPHRPAYRARMSDDPVTPKLQVQIDDDIAHGIYSNLVLINHTENEFVIDFAFIQPGAQRAKVRTRVISSPRHTKRLLAALQKNVERYEERFGTIDISNEDEPVVH
jgi:hypothetical protein